MKNLFLSMLAMVAMVSCTNEIVDNGDGKEVDNGQPVPIEFKNSILGVTTKAAPLEGANAFDENEIVGITTYAGNDVPTGAAIGSPHKQNLKFKVDAAGALTEEGSKTLFWQRGLKHYFYAYYPTTTSTEYTYTAAASTSGSEKAEQISVTIPSNGETTDLLMGKLAIEEPFAGIAPTDAKIQFIHKLSKVKLIFKKDASYTKTGALTKISITLNNKTRVYDMITQLGGLNSGGEITLEKDVIYNFEENSDGSIFVNWAPIVLPEASITNLTLKIDDADMSTNTFGSLAFEEGKMTTITITLKSSSISLASAVTPWESGGTPGVGEVQ